MPKRSALLVLFAFVCSLPVGAQTFYAIGKGLLYRIEIDLFACNNPCTITEVGPTANFQNGMAFCPDSSLYAYSSDAVYQIDIQTGDTSLVYQDGTGTESQGLVCVQDSLLYTLGLMEGLYEFNINSDTTTLIGNTDFQADEEVTAFEGQYYYNTHGSIVLLDIVNPANSVEIMSYDTSEYFLSGITGSSMCHTLIAVNGNGNPNEIIAINLAEQSITHVCYIPDSIGPIATYAEFIDPACLATIDLDCDDSSGAPNANFNAGTYHCLSDSLRIADDDIKIIHDDRVITTTINILNPVPDDPYEDLVMAAGVPGISVTGLGTASVVLTNDGMATVEDFKEALRRIFYINSTLPPTPGPRVIQVQITTESGMMSNIANTFFEVIELPSLPVNLGPDKLICEGSSTGFDAGHPGAMYVWSTSETTQTITASTQGYYSVTVSDDINCPGTDTVALTLMPNIIVSLIGDASTCQNSPVSLTLVTNSTIPLDIEVALSTGGTYSFLNVTGNLSFSGNPSTTTTYEITTVTADQPICLSMPDSLQTVVVYPTFFSEINVGLCGGDSIWLAYYWEHNAGVYNIQLTSQNGCDSIVLYTIESLPADVIQVNETTCDPSAAGFFTTSLPNPNGCDTIVQTIITLVPTDTTITSGTSCRIAEVGLDTLILTNTGGCDSVVISGIMYNAPADTTLIVITTCDAAMVGNDLQLIPGADGCDSLVMVSTVLASADTTLIFTSSCDPTMVGTVHTLLIGTDGCDSLLITTTEAIPPDTTNLFSTSCDSSLLGVVVNVYTNTIGCDSVVISTTTFSQQDSTFVNATTCDPAMEGTVHEAFVNQIGCDSIVSTTFSLILPVEVFISSFSCDPQSIGNFTDTLVSQLGCDSIVHENISLLSSSETQLFESTCASSEAGVFVTVLTNQYGCDSTVTTTISLIPPDTTKLYSQTCFQQEVDTVEIRLTDQFGCDSLVINTISLFTPTVLSLESVFNYNGFDVSCYDGDDGAIISHVSGTTPYQFEWSTGDIEQDLDNVSAGTYTLSVTDGNGCAFSQTISLEAPDELTASFEVSELTCIENNLGSVSIIASGGVTDYEYAVEGQPFQSSSIIANLVDGTYACIVRDANDCEVNGIIRIDIPLLVNVELGDDVFIQNGDSVHLKGVVNIPVDSVAEVNWTTLTYTDCPSCLDQQVSPLLTTVYYIQVVSVDGCIAMDSVTVHVLQEKGLFVPTIFSPNGDNINDRFLLHGKTNIRELSLMEIFDRWGNQVFHQSDFQPGDPSFAWDGSWNDKPQNPGVYAYRVIVTYIDGSQRVFVGDVTLIR